jgi:hypothetical protein
MFENESAPPTEECIGYLEKGPHDSHTWPYPMGGSRLCPGMVAEQKPDPVALARVMNDLTQTIDEGDNNEPHAILVTDPQSGIRHVCGPFATRFDARVARELLRARYIADDPELGDLVLEPVMIFPWAVRGRCSWCEGDLVTVSDGLVDDHKIVESDTGLCPGSGKPPAGKKR